MSEKHEIRGKLKIILPKYVSGTFEKIEFIIVTDEQYPQTLKLEVRKAKFDILENVFPGDDVNCYINIHGREWTDPTGKVIYFLAFSCWRIDKFKNNYREPKSEGSNHIQHNYKFPPENEVFGNPKSYGPEEGHSDLPF